MPVYELEALCANSMKSDMPTSIRVICDLIRAGISEACYHRNIIPEKCFTEIILNGVRGQTFACKLAVGSAKAGPKGPTGLSGDTIHNWCKEIGRLLMSQKSAVSRVTFGFSSVEDISIVLEEYLFDINVRGVAPPQSENSCQYQAMDILESLSFLVRTLDPIPKRKEGSVYTFVKVYLAEGNAPAVTNLLTEASEKYNHGISYYDQGTFQMRIGTLRTAHHSVTVGVCSALDSVTNPSKEQLAIHERVPDNLGMCSSVENATDVPSPFQRGTLGTPRSIKGKMLSDAMQKLQASPPSSSLDFERLPESNEGSMMTDEMSCMDITAKRHGNAKESLKRKRGGRLAGLLLSSGVQK